MKILLATIALFSLGTIPAAGYTPSRTKELPRGETLPYPTAAEAAQRSAANRYVAPVEGWQQLYNVFSAPFTVPFAWSGRQVLLRLEWASGEYEVRVNGASVGYDADGNAPAEFNLTRHTKEGRNTLEIVVREQPSARELESWKEPGQCVIGPARIISVPTMRIRDVAVKTWFAGTAPAGVASAGVSADAAAEAASEEAGANATTAAGSDTEATFGTGEAVAEVAIAVKSDALNPRTSRIHYSLTAPSDATLAQGYEDLTLDMRREDTVRFLARIPDTLLWRADRPVLLTLRLNTRHEGRYGEYLEIPLGFRPVEVRDGRMRIAGVETPLRIKEVSPRIDTAAARRLRAEGYNALRLQPGPVPEALMAWSDSTGMLLIAQAPIDTRRSGPSRRIGGNPSNDPQWREAYAERAESSYHTTKRHPSVVAFSLAVESANGINLYEAYLRMKRCDEQRPFLYPDAAGEWNSDRLIME